MMKHYLFPVFAAGVLLLAGCSSKQYFEPEQTYDISHQAESSYAGAIIDKSRDGATLEGGRYIGKEGIGKITLDEGYRFLSESSRYVLAGNSSGELKLINKKSGKIKTIDLHIPVVAASVKNGLIAYILNNNAFGLYRIKDGKKLVENRSERTFAIDTRAASPLFVDTLVVMPMLDGKLIIFDINDPETAKVVYLSSEKIFNNIVYLSRTGDTLVAATPKKLLTLGGDGEFDYRANIAEVVISGNSIYLFSKEGEIIKFNILLDELARKKFKFAQFSAATALNGNVYALDKQGSLIVLSSDLTKYKIYDIGEVESPVFISGNRLYKDGNIINLEKLGYE
jgi:hypothetical protein